MNSEPVTQTMFFEALSQMRKDFDDRHRNLRNDITAGFHEVSEKLDKHIADDLLIANDVLVIKTQRDSEAAGAIKKQTWIAGIITTSAIAVWEIVKHIIGWK